MSEEIVEIKLKWFKENIVELCVVLIVINGLIVMTYSILAGMILEETRMLDLFVNVMLFAMDWLFKAKTST
jgi:hypothetical protein